VGFSLNDRVLREHVRKLLAERQAHVGWKTALKGFPAKKRGARPSGSPYSAWELLEHTRIAQWDILEFSRNPKHVSPDWPSGYWPKNQEPPSSKAWDKSFRSIENDLKSMIDLVMDPKTDLLSPIPHGSGQTVLREALLLADHNSYHLGQLILLRRLLGAWKEK
jgi:hypothetical protein